MKKATFIFLPFFLLCACVGGDKQTTQVQSNHPTTMEQANATEYTPTPIFQITAVSAEPPQNKLPVAVSFFQESEVGNQIVSVLLGKNIEYPLLSIGEKASIFLGPAAVDSQNNLFLMYGYRDNYISKLSPDGTIITKLLPFVWILQAVWIGETLVIVPIDSTKPTYIVDTQLNIKEISPFLNRVTDSAYANAGFLGIADAANNLAIWVFTKPVQTETGTFAHYRTLDVVSGKTVDGMLPIPDHSEEFSPTNDPNDRLGTLVYGVDSVSQHVLLCYGQSAEDNTVSTILELYASQSGHTIQQEERCCLNNIFDLRGDTFIENHTPETCSARTIQNWSDMESAIDVEQFLISPKQNDSWIISNGMYWVIKTNHSLAVFSTDMVLKAEYELPDDLPKDLNNGATFQIGLLMQPAE